ncbi:MAG TPA: HD domain-containing phosphohydrolase [Planctomycetota bacterium]|nr:HD domain-containing phosphohydrolase [Planctomycetota bacterium]
MPPLDKPRITVSQALNSSVRKYGRAILCNLTISLRTSRLYSASHQIVTAALADLEEYILSFIRLEGSCHIARASDSLFLNDVRIKVDFGSYQSYHHVLDVLKERDAGELVFKEGLTHEEVVSLIALLNEPAPPTEDTWLCFEKSIRKAAMPHIEIRNHHERQDLEVDDAGDGKLQTISTYFKTISTMDSVFQAVSSGKHINLKRLKHAVQAISDLTLNEEYLLLSLVNVKKFGGPGSNHAVNVALLSVALGAKLGLTKKLLSDRGFVALLHDIGKAQLPEKILHLSPLGLRGESLKIYKTHVFSGVEKLLDEQMADVVVKSINVAFLHHYRHDRTGFPKLLNEKDQNLSTRIVAVADFYDNATTHPGPSGVIPTPEAVLREIMELGGTEFDPLVVKAFVNLMGLYPVGCMVRLDTGEVGTVVDPPRNPRFPDRPNVKLIADSNGLPVNRTVNLLERGEDGGFLRTILKLYQQEEVRLELDEYLAVI